MNMVDWMLIVVGVFLLIAGIIDWKVKRLPSIFLTAMIFAVAMLNPANLWFGIMGCIIAYLIYEAGFFNIADVKVMIMISFLISTTNWLFAYILLTVCFGVVWIAFVHWRLKTDKECPFIPVFIFIYITIWILGGFA